MNEVIEFYNILNQFCPTSRYVEKKQGLEEYLVYHDEVSEIYYADNFIHNMTIHYNIDYYQPFHVDRKYDLFRYLAENGIVISNISETIKSEYLVVSFVGTHHGTHHGR